ncbi:hypothetical protein CAI18_23230 (plasmid) [Xanthomonas citri pv. punicae]|uniref:hypothetical protein n=1 Tax=Xanthomonas TaxID=338 RepID=UPI000528DB2B|nr:MULTISPECIES: hypothetical protein [Xanthomonas]QCZ67369.1 hypothetical protein CAI14_23075 [Xanthomonas citri pv. punicae]QCZ71472.1 hypothetical protein CAI17_23560 [Xanthomonas citri pv. punicae]QCZ79652.1 hypothetical protein XapA_23745 [Xanthomonas citri pv. punicae]QCZ83720.1 hypothetical protein XapB_23080 [Xanthomonas citri pv. punicae]QCZ87880.1 hypothetical protein CAI18_23230 [Xanthomonas citri pv. punicae]
MRNVWMIVSGLAVVVAIGGAVYYFFPEQPAGKTSNVQQLPSNDGHVLVAPAGNPLLNADANQFGRWVPLYPIRCGEIVFDKADPRAPNFSFCIGEIKRRVTTATGYQLSREDVLDYRVKAHWREVMGAK